MASTEQAKPLNAVLTSLPTTIFEVGSWMLVSMHSHHDHAQEFGLPDLIEIVLSAGDSSIDDHNAAQLRKTRILAGCGSVH